MTKFGATKVTIALLIIGLVSGCQSATVGNSISQETLVPSTCIAEPPPVDKNGKPMTVTLEDMLSMELRVFFDRDSAEIKDKYVSELNKIIEFAARCSNLTLFVQGHTSKIEQQSVDNKVAHIKDSSQQLIPVSLAGTRAQSIKDYLVNLGLPANRVRTFNCSSDDPIARNDTEEGATMNQRVFGWISARDRYNDTLVNCKEILE